MSQRSAIVSSIANTIQDYRGGSLPQPVSDHVETWVQQFDSGVQLKILEEIDHVLKQLYFSKARMEEFLRNLIHTPKLTGANPASFWRCVNFLDIQLGGKSQTEMLILFSRLLEEEFGFKIGACGPGSDVFVYLDDGIFTGNRVLSDLKNWICCHAPTQATVHVICIAMHRYGEYYAKKNLKDVINSSSKRIEIEWWSAFKLEDRRNYTATADVLRPTEIPNDSAVQAYVATMQHQPTLRTPGSSGAMGLFTNEAAKYLLEQEFLKAGVHIRQKCSNLSSVQRPLGHMSLETLGFGSLIVTYRNCPNNAPLVFWVGSPWYPLFPRTTNTQTAAQRSLAGLTEGESE